MVPDTETASRAGGRLRRQRHSLWRLVRANLYDLLLLVRESSLVLIGFAVVVLIGTLYFRFLAHLPLGRALYEAVKLLLFASSQGLPSDLLGQTLFFLIPLLGLALLAQGVLNFGRLIFDKSTRREAWQVALASTYRRHVIVCGLGHVGLRVVTHLLEAGYEVVVIERDWNSKFVPRALTLKAPVVLGDAREAQSLHQAGLKRARAVVASVNNDLLNIEIALAARAQHPGIHTILRAFNEELDRNLRRSFGPNAAFSPSVLAAPTLAAAAVSHRIDYVLTLEGSTDLLGVRRFTLQPAHQLSGPVWKLEEHEGVRVLAYQDAAGRSIMDLVGRELVIGTQLTLLGPLAALEAFRLKNNAIPVDPDLVVAHHPEWLLDRVIICGLGKVGYRVVQRLYGLDPRPQITIIHLAAAGHSFSQQISHLPGITTVIGDARDEALLHQAGIDRATTIAAITADDLVNLQIALAARRARPDVHLVLRVFSDTLAEKLADLFQISTTYSTSELAGSTLAASAILSGVGQAFFVGNRLFATDQRTAHADDRLSGASIQTIRAHEHALVIALRRDGLALTLPPLETIIVPGDRLTLLAPLDVLTRLRKA